MEVQEKFNKALEDIQTLSEEPSQQDLLTLYGLYKQSKVGDVSGPRPVRHDMAARAKYMAWKKCLGLEAEEAMQSYIEKVTEMLEEDAL